MIVSGQTVLSEKLASTKLFDQIVEGDLITSAKAFARRVVDEGKSLPRVRDIRIEHPDAQALLQFARNTVGAVARNFPAPMKCIEAVAAAVSKPFDEAMRFERALFLELVQTPESRALRHAFFGERAASKIPDVPEDTPLREIRSAAVIGAGTMGAASR